MNPEMVQKDNSQSFELKRSRYEQSVSNVSGSSNLMAQKLYSNPDNPNQNYTATNMQPNPGNSYQYPYPQPYSNVIPNDVTREICASLGCSIFNTIFCVFLLGIPAVIFSCKANDNVYLGRMVEAQSDAKIAKILNIVGICLGSVVIAAATIYVIVIFTTSPRDSTSIYSLLFG
jgi:hypothetical protein